MLTMQMRIEGLPQTRSTLQQVKRVLRDLRPAFQKTSDYLLDVFGNQAFESEGAVYGLRWPQLDPHYALKKSQEYPGRGILERTGRLRRGFKAISTSSYLIIHNDVVYGKYHQGGFGRLPQRVIVALQKRQRDEVEAIIRNDILSRIKGSL